MPKYKQEIAHGNALEKETGECLHPLCKACRDEAVYRVLVRIALALERIVAKIGVDKP